VIDGVVAAFLGGQRTTSEDIEEMRAEFEAQSGWKGGHSALRLQWNVPFLPPISTGWSDTCRMGVSPTENARLLTAHKRTGPIILLDLSLYIPRPKGIG
jgi:hypothetical protein